MRNVFKRELRVMFNPKSQSIGFRIAKYVILGLVIYFFWGSAPFWWMLTALLLAGVVSIFFTVTKPGAGRAATAGGFSGGITTA